MMRPLVSIALLAALALPAHAAPPSVVSGPVRVVDGDTIVLTNTNTRVRLNGVDAPEVVHPGYDHDDDFEPEARAEMRSIVGDAIVRCELNGERSHERLVGVCYLPDGTDIGAEIIRRGLALDCARWSSGAIATRACRDPGDHPPGAVLPDLDPSHLGLALPPLPARLPPTSASPMKRYATGTPSALAYPLPDGAIGRN